MPAPCPAPVLSLLTKWSRHSSGRGLLTACEPEGTLELADVRRGTDIDALFVDDVAKLTAYDRSALTYHLHPYLRASLARELAADEARPHGQPGRLPLPFPPSQRAQARVGNSFGQLQTYANRRYLHDGIDLRVPAGTPVTLARPGRVQIHLAKRSIYTAVHVEEVSPRGYPTGRRWDYVHIDPASIPEQVRAAAASRRALPAGTVVGAVIPWSNVDQTDGQRYDHLHLSVGMWDAARGTYGFLDPLDVVDVLDRHPPVVLRVLLLDADTNRVWPDERPVVRGALRVAVEGHDLVTDRQPHEPADPRGEFSLGIPKVRVHMYPASGNTGPTLTRQSGPPHGATQQELFNSLSFPTAAYASYIREDGQAPALTRSDNVVRRMIRTGTGIVDTTQLPDGPYVLTVEVEDANGNVTSRRMELEIRNQPAR